MTATVTYTDGRTLPQLPLNEAVLGQLLETLAADQGAVLQ
jgi:hypothetical protein